MALLHERISMKNLWRISQNFLHTCHSSSILLCISSKNMWKICEEYVTVYCLKFYIISNKFKSVWIYLKLWRILLNTIEIWTNLKGLTNTKRSKMKNREKERERVFYEHGWWKKARWIHKVIIMKYKWIFVSTNATGKIQHENLQVMINITFLILRNLCIFYTDTFSILW